MKYAHITLEEMKAALPESDRWVWTILGGEHVACRAFKDPRPDLSIYVYTSINVGSSAGHAKGTDCIRVIGIRQVSRYFVKPQPLTSGKLGRVLRVEGWRKNLAARVEEVVKLTRERRDWVPKEKS